MDFGGGLVASATAEETAMTPAWKWQGQQHGAGHGGTSRIGGLRRGLGSSTTAADWAVATTAWAWTERAMPAGLCRGGDGDLGLIVYCRGWWKMELVCVVMEIVVWVRVC
ncbi:hypothetical protein M0R45_030912 [Rubus argutus]|uniref:Uncharacterized protein n=1 Tax=Rubus argutus TaxID=59490 RepID=A0AAW1WCY2_RUBAR